MKYLTIGEQEEAKQVIRKKRTKLTNDKIMVGIEVIEGK